MCRYCENILKNNKIDGDTPHRDLLPCATDTRDYPEYDTMACVIEPTPVSRRMHKDDGLVAQLNVYFSDEKAKVANMFIPIRYCPMCGRDLSGETCKPCPEPGLASMYSAVGDWWETCLMNLDIDPEWARNFPTEILSWHDGDRVSFNRGLVGGEFGQQDLPALFSILSESETAKGLYDGWEPRCDEEVEYERLKAEYVAKHRDGYSKNDFMLSGEIEACIDFNILYHMATELPASESRLKFMSEGIISEKACEPLEAIQARTEEKKWRKLRDSVERVRDASVWL